MKDNTATEVVDGAKKNHELTGLKSLDEDPKKHEKAVDTSDNASEEASLLSSLQIILRMNGLERSISSIRDMADLTDGEFGYTDAVSALENLEHRRNCQTGQLPWLHFQLYRGNCFHSSHSPNHLADTKPQVLH